MKTAIQELFSKLEIEHPNLFNTNTPDGRQFINDYYQFFELEKQQIYNAFYRGIQDEQLRFLIDYERRTPEQYYNETFKTN